MDVVRDAGDALECEQLARRVAGELDELCRDPEAWAAYVGEADGAVADGIA